MGSVLGNRGKSGPQPVTKYCMATPIRLETIQYRESPMGKFMEKNAIISGIIHSIMVCWPCCRGSVDWVMVIFCWTQVETNTKAGTVSIRAPAGWADRSTPRNFGSRGTAV